MANQHDTSAGRADSPNADPYALTGEDVSIERRRWTEMVARDPQIDPATWSVHDEEEHQALLAETHQRRQRKRMQSIFLAGLGGLLVVLLGIGFASYQGWIKLPFAPGKVEYCPEPEPTAMAADRTKVTVVNTTATKGLAAQVSAQLKERKFFLGTPKTYVPDPKRPAPSPIAEVRFGADGKMQAKTVAAHVNGAVMVQDDRKGAAVDLLIGPQYAGLVAPEVAAQALVVPPPPSPKGCRPREKKNQPTTPTASASP